MEKIFEDTYLQLGAIALLLFFLGYALRYLLRIEQDFRHYLQKMNSDLTHVIEEHNKLTTQTNTIISKNNMLFSTLMKKINKKT